MNIDALKNNIAHKIMIYVNILFWLGFILATPVVAAENVAANDASFFLRIVSAEEKSGAVRGEIETNMPLPIEIMVDVSLHSQRSDDIYVGKGLKLRIEASPQTFSVPINIDGGLPRGAYDVEATFYPRWGAEHGSPAARAIRREISATKQITLRGSGKAAREVIAYNEARRWLMETTAVGDPWKPAEFEKHLGHAERLRVTNRPNIIVAFYYPRADATVFVNTLLNELVTWAFGRQTAL
jgi:hypothetical protein